MLHSFWWITTTYLAFLLGYVGSIHFLHFAKTFHNCRIKVVMGNSLVSDNLRLIKDEAKSSKYNQFMMTAGLKLRESHSRALTGTSGIDISPKKCF